MKRQLIRWLKNTGKISFIFLLLPCLVLAEDNPKDPAQAMYEQFKGRAGSSESLQQNFMNPLLGGGNISTIDLSQSGQAQVLCPGSKEFLTVVVQPTSTGDFNAQIYWDSNFDSKLDRSTAVNGVSGVCANGFIICDPGKWINCAPYRFNYDKNTKNISFIPSEITDLSGCFCINNSCGSNLIWNNLTLVVKTFGGAVAGAFQQADPRYAISQARIDGTAIYFYGQQAQNCTVASGGSGVTNPEQYYNSPALISSATELEVYTQSQDPESYYNLVISPLQNQTHNSQMCADRYNAYPDYKECEYPSPTVTQNTEPYCPGYSVGTCGENCLYINFGFKDTPHTSTYAFRLSHPERVNRAVLSVDGLDDDGGKAFYFNGHEVYRTGGGSSCFWGYSGDVTSLLLQNNTIVINGSSGGCGSWNSHDRCGYVRLTILYNSVCPGHPELSCDGNIPPRCCIPQVERFNGCDDLSSRSDCVLRDQKIDGVYVIRDGVKTGLIPLKQCQTVCGVPVCPDFWVSEKTFLCTQEYFDLSGAKKRLSTVVPSTQYSESQGMITFTDIRNENDNWQTYPNQQFYVGNDPNKPDDCEQACRVRIPQTAPQVGLGGPESQHKTSSAQSHYIYYYRACVNGVCPVQAGEEVDISCRCMNDFGNAATAMAALRMAGQDIICSSGNIKTLPGY